MSEYQRYEFMTSDRPLTREQLDRVNKLSSHIEASSTHALIEYHWGDFKHDPIQVLHEFFDGFLYWANWGSPQLALRFPHNILPADLMNGLDLNDVATFTQYPDYDILDINFGEMEGPDEWEEYELGVLIALRDELMEDDLRSLYIVWLASQGMYERDDDDDEISVLSVPPAFGDLTSAQCALAELLQVPQELLAAAARHSHAAKSSLNDDIAAWITLLPPARCTEYLIRLAHNEPGLSRLLVKELRELGQSKEKTLLPTGERVAYTQLLAESRAIKKQLEREKQQQEQLARQQHLQDIQNRQDDYWHQAEIALLRKSGTGYDEATRLLVELRDAANHFHVKTEFQERFLVWVQPHMSRPAFVKRLQDQKFTLPEM